MNKKYFLLMVIFVVCLSGCVRENSKESIPSNGDIFALDWEKISIETDELYVNEQTYPMSESVNYFLDENNNVFNLTLIVKDGTTSEIAVQYTTEIAKGINDLAAKQDSYFEHSGELSFGGLYKELDLRLIVIPGSPYTEESDYLVDQTIPAGTYQPIIAKSQ